MRRLLFLRGAELLAFAVLGAIPLLVLNEYALGLLTLLSIYGILLIGLDVTVGYLGQVNLAQIAFLGLGGSLLALLGLFSLWLPVSRGVGGLSPMLVELARLGFFSWGSMLLLAFVGAATGALGALWAFLSTRKAQREEQALMEGVG